MGRLVVLYDADCGVCQASVRWLRPRDRSDRLEFVALQHAAESERALLRHVAATHPLHEEIHIVDEVTGRVTAGGRAMLLILTAVPRWRILARLFLATPPTVWLADLAYGVIARNRDAVGRVLGLEASCRLPSG